MKKLFLASVLAAGFALPSKAAFPMPGYRLTFLTPDGLHVTYCSGLSKDCGTIYTDIHNNATYMIETYNNGDPNQIYERVYTNEIDIQQVDGGTQYTYMPI